MGRALKVKKERLSDRVIKFVTTREDEEFAALSVSSLARTFKMDRFKLSRTFKAEKNMTLEFCLMQEKMFRCAFILMSNRNITVKEVSELMGFCTCDYFIQVFKKYFGIVPGQYKEYKTRRSGMKDRRVGPPDRRNNPDGKVPESGDHRKGLKDRRIWPKDRRRNATMEIDSFNNSHITDRAIRKKKKKKRVKMQIHKNCAESQDYGKRGAQKPIVITKCGEQESKKSYEKQKIF